MLLLIKIYSEQTESLLPRDNRDSIPEFCMYLRRLLIANDRDHRPLTLLPMT